MFFETHAHYDDAKFSDIERVVEKIREAGVDYAVNCGVNVRSSQACARLAERFDMFYAAAGVHPSDVMEAKQTDLALIKKNRRGRKSRGNRRDWAGLPLRMVGPSSAARLVQTPARPRQRVGTARYRAFARRSGRLL